MNDQMAQKKDQIGNTIGQRLNRLVQSNFQNHENFNI